LTLPGGVFFNVVSIHSAKAPADFPQGIAYDLE
jgi:hypothetical protein